jgi:DNA-directed RNA polymerase subunit H (RpoH/RPB5)
MKQVREIPPMKSETSNIEKRAKLLIKYRKMKVRKKEVDEANNTNYYLMKDDEKNILQCITGERVIGIAFIRELSKLVDESGSKKGIIVSDVKYTYSAKANAPKYRVELIPPTLPTFDLFKHNLVSPAELLNEGEKQEILQKYHAEAYQFPRIPSRDPVSILLGARPGDMIQFTVDSINAGESIVYRYVA